LGQLYSCDLISIDISQKSAITFADLKAGVFRQELPLDSHPFMGQDRDEPGNGHAIEYIILIAPDQHGNRHSCSWCSGAPPFLAYRMKAMTLHREKGSLEGRQLRQESVSN
jgi:hypothetical protein